MTENPTPNSTPLSPPPARAPFPFVRLLYAIGYAILAWIVIHLIFLAALVQFVIVAITARTNAELKKFSFALVQYLLELSAFICFLRDDRPFPIGPFPKV
jgi:hypothetical protein